MKTLALLAILPSLLLLPSVASSQETSYTTRFQLITRVGDTTRRYSLSTEERVVMPAGVNWACNSIPVQMSSDGSVYRAGFVCVNDRKDRIEVAANCYAARPDHELKDMAVTTTDDHTGVIRFLVECSTTEDGSEGGPNPFLRRTSAQ